MGTPAPGPILSDAADQATRSGSVPPGSGVTRSHAGSGGTPVGSVPVPTIAGYEVLGEIGRGGMGVVFKARHLTLNRVVALKVIADPSGTSAAKLVRFRQEAEAVAKLQHPNIVQIFETGVADGRPYLALEFVDGPTLKQTTSGVPQPPRDAARTLETVARAVHHAHEHRVVHRDVKPHNILLSSGGVPKVTDFGLARTLDSGGGVTMTADFVGTPAYSAPEQVQNRHHDIGPATDVYALGATLYELLTGHPPFESASLSALLRMVVEQEPTPIRRLRPDCPRDLETVCLKCLRKEPGQRYESAAALADDLRRFQADEPISARPVGNVERGWRWTKRNPVVAGLVAAVGVLLLAGAVGGTIAAAQFKEKADEALKAKKDADDARREVGVQLWRSQLSEARANTRSGLPGQRFKSLELLKTALAAARETGLTEEDKKQFRDVAVAALALPDVEVVKEWDGYPNGTNHLAADARFERYTRSSADGTVTVRRVADDVELYSLPGAGQKRSVTLSDSGKVLVVCDDGVAEAERRGRVYRLDGPEPVLLHDTPMIFGRHAFVTPDDRRVVYINSDAVNVWDHDTGRTDSWPLPGRQLGLASLTRDGRRVACPCAAGNAAVLHVREVETGRVIADLKLPQAIDSTGWHPDGRVVAAVQRQKIHLWDVETKREIRVLEGHRNFGVTPTFDHTGERLISNDWSAILRVWDWRAGRQLLNLPSAWFFHARLVSADGRLLTHSQDGRNLWLLRLAAGLERRPFGPLRSSAGYMRVDPAGRLAVVTLIKEREYGNLVATDLSRGTELGRFSAGRGERAFHIADDGALLTNGYDGIVRWPRAEDPQTGIIRFGPPQQLRTSFTTDIHSASADGRVAVYPNYNSGAVALRTDRIGMPISFGPQEDVRSTAVSPDGRLLATGSHGTTTGVGAKVWDAQTGEQVTEFKILGGTLTFSPDGRWLATNGGGLRLWRSDTWTAGPEIPDASKTNGCVFSPDSRVLAVGGHAAVRLVRADDGAELVRLPFLEQAKFLPQCFSPDGAHLYAINQDTAEVVVWDLRQLRAELTDLGLDWDAPPLPPPAVVAPVSRVEFVGTELLADPKKMAAHRWDEIVGGVLANPFDSEWYTRWGLSALGGGYTTCARTLFDIAVALNPTREDARLHRARAHQLLRQYDRAVADATFVLDRYPTQLDARRVRAAAYRQLGKHADAAADLSAILQIQTTNVSVLIDRAAAYRAAWDEAKATADLRRADELAGGAAAGTVNNLAWQLVTGPPATRDPKRALELITKVVAGQPNNATYLNTLGVVQYRTGLFKEAVVSLEKSLAVGGGTSDGFDLYFLAMCHAKLGDPAKAAKRFDEAVRWAEKSTTLTDTDRAELAAFRREAEGELK